ncbi:hypothetical protein TNCV_4070221 [Trichonephila clavipes]|nr:hypothetical protein TNCV_4070221 [Trichonephila clavipes]
MEFSKSWPLVAITLATEQSVLCDFFKGFCRSQTVRPPNDPVSYSPTNSDSPQFYFFKSPNMVIPDTSKSTNFVLPVEIPPTSPKKVGQMYSGSINENQTCLGTVKRQTDPLTETSTHTPQHLRSHILRYAL